MKNRTHSYGQQDTLLGKPVDRICPNGELDMSLWKSEEETCF